MSELARLVTESRNPASEEIDRMSALEIVRLINAEDAKVAAAVGEQAEAIARAVESIAKRLSRGGRLVYLGAGTSGRLGVLDASECPPTFQTPPEMVVGLIAGGPVALTRAVEGAEDRPEAAVEQLAAIPLRAQDVLVGIATSGRTPFVLGGLRFARSLGAFTIGLSCNPDSQLGAEVDVAITPVVGPEVISGSTRMKAGTATKMVLNMLTTGAMVLLGKTYGNLMVDLKATNRKLIDRTRRIVAALCGITAEEAERELARCGGELKTAVVARQRGVVPEEARRVLAQAGGHLRRALDTGACMADEGRVRSSCREPLLLAMDGGGTKTVAWLAARRETGVEVLGRGTAGPSNIAAMGRSAALNGLDCAVDAAFVDAGLAPQPLAAAVLGLAGSDRDENRQIVREWADRRGLGPHLRIVHDGVPVLAAGTPDGWGVALIGGTGSLAYGQDREGRAVRSGGWGYLMGDEGSGYAIAVAGLRAAAQAADGRGEPTSLVAAFCRRFQVARPLEMISGVYRIAADRAAVAAAAEVVLHEAAAGDWRSQQILDGAARELAAMVANCAERLDLAGSPFPLAFTGGLLVGSDPLRQAVLAQLSARGNELSSVQVVTEPVAGALCLARSMLSED